MMSTILVVSPVFKGGDAESQVIAESAWAAMPPRHRVHFDYGQCFPGILRSAYDVKSPPEDGDLPRAICGEAFANRGIRIPRGDELLPGDRHLMAKLHAAGFSVLVTTRWFLSLSGGRGEQALVDFLGGSSARMIGYVDSTSHWEGPDRHVTELVQRLHEAAGERLLTVYHPPLSGPQPRLPGRSIAGLIHPEEPLPEWLASIVRDHAGLPIAFDRFDYW